MFWFEDEIPIDSVEQIGFDTQFEEKKIREITKEKRGYDVTFVDGWSMGWPLKEGFEAKVGDTARCYGRGIGSPVRGVAVNGHVLYYETEEEYDAKMKYEFAKMHRNDAVKNWMRRDTKKARIDALPAILRERMYEFEEREPGFFLKSDSDYELFIYEEAVKIAETLKTVEAINAFREEPYERQVEMVELSDGHSGNTFYSAIGFARWLVEEEAVV